MGDVSEPGSGFASSQNRATLIDVEEERELPLSSKRALADLIWDRVAELRLKGAVR